MTHAVTRGLPGYLSCEGRGGYTRDTATQRKAHDLSEEETEGLTQKCGKAAAVRMGKGSWSEGEKRSPKERGEEAPH